ncbi:MAG: tRNA threonylcarbamoyladenosine dehydratase, partial [Oscillospiraceae bacterium]|nr:tRNA threonylcarbamoyladenosine dehydratase [Oscillospiraceae bacterium]
ERDIPCISALGTGNKADASQLRIDDISKTYGCALARVVRKELKNRAILHHPVVFSPEEPMEPEQFEAPPPGRRSVPGSLVWVPATAGMLLCQYVIMNLSK